MIMSIFDNVDFKAAMDSADIDQLKALLQAERDNSLFMAKRIDQLEKLNLELAVDLSTKRIEVKEYELWIAGIADYCGSLPAWLRQSAKNMLAKGAK